MPDMTEEEWQAQLADERRRSIEGANYTSPIPADAPAAPQEPDNPPVEAPTQTAEPPQAYRGEAFPGLPVLVDRGQGPGGADQYTYNGTLAPTEQAAMALRSQDAANPQSQAAYAQAQEQRPQPQPGQASPEMTSIQLRAELDRHTLSRADQLELTQLQNGIARVQADAREGRVPTAQAIQIQRQLQERLNPKMITMQQANAIRSALQTRLLSEQVMHQTLANADSVRYRNATVGRDGPPISGDGQWVEQTPGHWAHISTVRQPTTPANQVNGPGGIQDTLHNSLIHDIETQMAHEAHPRELDAAKPEWAATTESRQAEFDRRYGQRMDLLTAQRPPNPESAPLMRDIATRFGAAERQIQQPSGVTSGIDNLLGNVAGVEPDRQDVQRRTTELNRIRSGLENIVQRYPRPDTMPQVERRRFNEFYRKLNELLTPAASSASPSNPVAVPPIRRPVGSQSRPLPPEFFSPTFTS